MTVKRMNRRAITLVNVVMDGDYQYEQELPLGLASVGAFLREKGYEVTFHQCFASRGDQEISKAAAAEGQVYGFQLNIVNYLPLLQVITRLKTRNPDAVTLLGGPFLVSHSEEIMKKEPLVDFIITGEGEATLLELLEALLEEKSDLTSINGLVWRGDGGSIIRNEPRCLIENLDTLPFPARDFMETARKDPADNGMIDSVRISTSRGCIGKCSFCCVNLYNKVQKGRRWRGRSPAHVVDELEMLSRMYNARVFNFSDSSFEDPGRQGKTRSIRICEEILRRDLKVSIKIYMRCETLVTDEDIERLKLYKKAGVDVIIIGAEAGSDYELRLYDKHATLEDNYRAAKTLRELDLFYVLVGFIMFGPYSTLDSLRSNIHFLNEFNMADNLMQSANILMLLRDSKIYHMLKGEGRVIETDKAWELPRYTFLDPRIERMARNMQNLFVRYPHTLRVNKLQVSIENILARMLNTMNKKVLDCLRSDFERFKECYYRERIQFGKLHHDYFLSLLELIEHDASDETISLKGRDFFETAYAMYEARYSELSRDFIQKIRGAGFSLSGLIFEHFHSAMAIDGTERI